MARDLENMFKLSDSSPEALYFPMGIVGFPRLKTCSLREIDFFERGVLYLMNSMNEENLKFVLGRARKLLPFYNPSIEKSHLEVIGLHGSENYEIYLLLNLNISNKVILANTQGPIVVNNNVSPAQAVQPILSGPYCLRTPVVSLEKH